MKWKKKPKKTWKARERQLKTGWVCREKHSFTCSGTDTAFDTARKSDLCLKSDLKTRNHIQIREHWFLICIHFKDLTLFFSSSSYSLWYLILISLETVQKGNEKLILITFIPYWLPTVKIQHNSAIYGHWNLFSKFPITSCILILLLIIKKQQAKIKSDFLDNIVWDYGARSDSWGVTMRCKGVLVGPLADIFSHRPLLT